MKPDQIEFPNPWHDPRNELSRRAYVVSRQPTHQEAGFSFYNTLGNVSVIAVKDGKVVTECVTVAGARRNLGLDTMGTRPSTDKDYKWVYVDEKGTEMGWFNDEKREALDRSPDGKQPHSWRRLAAAEVAEFKATLGRLAYEQS